jgi:hypothetical protein
LPFQNAVSFAVLLNPSAVQGAIVFVPLFPTPIVILPLCFENEAPVYPFFWTLLGKIGLNGFNFFLKTIRKGGKTKVHPLSPC